MIDSNIAQNLGVNSTSNYYFIRELIKVSNVGFWIDCEKSRNNIKIKKILKTQSLRINNELYVIMKQFSPINYNSTNDVINIS